MSRGALENSNSMAGLLQCIAGERQRAIAAGRLEFVLQQGLWSAVSDVNPHVGVGKKGKFVC